MIKDLFSMYSCFSVCMSISSVMVRFFLWILIVYDLFCLRACQFHYLGVCSNGSIKEIVKSSDVFSQLGLIGKQKIWKEFCVSVWNTLGCPLFPYISAQHLSVFSKAVIISQVLKCNHFNLELQLKNKIYMPFNYSVKCWYLQLEKKFTLFLMKSPFFFFFCLN